MEAGNLDVFESGENILKVSVINLIKIIYYQSWERDFGILWQ